MNRFFHSQLKLSTLFFGALVLLVGSANSDVKSTSSSQLGLVVAWETNIGGAPLAHGSHSFVVWPHSNAKTEFVTVKSGSRILQQFNGDEIDHAAIERAILQGERLTTTPKLGLEGAKANAEKLVTTYAKMGKTLIVEPFSQRLTYIVTLTSNGILVGIDGETGAILWKSEAGDTRLEMHGPGVSDEYVVMTNGIQLFVFDLAKGNLVATRKLLFSPTGAPTAAGGMAFVPSIEGRLVAYNILDQKAPPIVLRSGTENRIGVVHSSDRNFLGWPMGNRLFIASLGEKPNLWTSIALNESVSNLPVASLKGFVFSGSEGTVVHCGTDRMNSLFWKTRLATPVSKSPVIGQNVVLVVSDEGSLIALDLETGTELWERPVTNINEIASVGKQHAYVTNSSRSLVSIQLSDGKETARSSNVFPKVLPNSVSDRLFFITPSGVLTCMREANADQPTFVADHKTATDATSVKPAPSTEAGTTETPEASNIFGEEPMKKETAEETENVFGTDPL
ncbi:MAG: PQQ-binding-like beta-propeller repeat protein [Pirellula sp.]